MDLNRRITCGLAVVAAVAMVACSTPNGGESKPTPTTATVHAAPAITVAPFGNVDDTPVQLYTLTNQNGLVAKITK